MTLEAASSVGRPARVSGMRFVQAPAVLRHFTARFEPIGGALLAE